MDWPKKNRITISARYPIDVLAMHVDEIVDNETDIDLWLPNAAEKWTEMRRAALVLDQMISGRKNDLLSD